MQCNIPKLPTHCKKIISEVENEGSKARLFFSSSSKKVTNLIDNALNQFLIKFSKQIILINNFTDFVSVVYVLDPQISTSQILRLQRYFIEWGSMSCTQISPFHLSFLVSVVNFLESQNSISPIQCNGFETMAWNLGTKNTSCIQLLYNIP